MKHCISFIILCLFAVPAAIAQKDADAKKILGQVSARYKAYDAVKADFLFTVDNPQAGVKQNLTGTLLAKSKTDRFKVTIYTQAAGKPAVFQELISDGKTQWTYLKANNEVELHDADKSSDALNPAQIFTMYEKGYKYVYTGDEKLNGKLCQVIELSPVDTKKSIFKVRLFIDKVKKEIYSANLFDKSGARYTYTIKNFIAGAAAPDAAFTFDAKAHPGVEVVDLR